MHLIALAFWFCQTKIVVQWEKNCLDLVKHFDDLCFRVLRFYVHLTQFVVSSYFIWCAYEQFDIDIWGLYSALYMHTFIFCLCACMHLICVYV